MASSSPVPVTTSPDGTGHWMLARHRGSWVVCRSGEYRVSVVVVEVDWSDGVVRRSSSRGTFQRLTVVQNVMSRSLS